MGSRQGRLAHWARPAREQGGVGVLGRRRRGESARTQRRTRQCESYRRGGCISQRVGAPRVPIHPICRHAHINALECKELSEVVWWSDFDPEQGLKVLLHCRHGHHRTGVAIYLLLRSILEEPAQCLSLMKAMRPVMHKDILRRTHHRHLFSSAETIVASPEFRAGVSCMRRWNVIESRRASSCGCISPDV